LNEELRAPLDLAPMIHRNPVDDLVDPGPRAARRVDLADRYDEGVLDYVNRILSWEAEPPDDVADQGQEEFFVERGELGGQSCPTVLHR
jgi:hypothetical protein